MEKFGSLTFVKEAGSNKHGKAMWKLICDCGNETTAIASAVRTGRTKSCGCGKRRGSRRTHGQRGSRLYTIWCNMKARCDNQKHPAYHNYGGRGVAYDPTWSDFSVFAASVGEPPSDMHSLDRVDNSRGYAADNVRWATRSVQSRNKRQNVWVRIGARVKCLHDWCAEFGITAGAVYRRMGCGEDIVSAITRPKADRFRAS